MPLLASSQEVKRRPNSDCQNSFSRMDGFQGRRSEVDFSIVRRSLSHYESTDDSQFSERVGA